MTWGRRMREQRRRPFSAARDLGLSVDRAGLRLQGEITGHRVTNTWTSMEAPTRSCVVWFRDGGLGMRLDIRRRNALLPQIRKSAVTTGDESFDVLLRVRTTAPERLRPVLDERLRRQILDLAFAGSLHVMDKKVFFSPRAGPPTEGKEILTTVRSVLEVADALERSRT